jgi:general secretion pathway protein A
MHFQYFGFREEPFGVTPDARFFFPSPQHAEACASLYYAIAQRRGFAVLIGAPGLGKTTTLVNVAARMAARARIAMFVHPRFETASALESVLLAMGLEPEPLVTRRHSQLHDFLLDLYRQGKTCVVIFDEAQNLTAESLESIRMLSNFETPRQKLIQFILAGQPGLARLLRAPECEQVLQRVNIIARLEPLTARQTEQYIARRLDYVGAAHNPFSAAALRAIAAASKGVPRNINTICFNALTLAFALGKRIIDEADINEVVKDLALDVNVEALSSLPALGSVRFGLKLPRVFLRPNLAKFVVNDPIKPRVSSLIRPAPPVPGQVDPGIRQQSNGVTRSTNVTVPAGNRK